MEIAGFDRDGRDESGAAEPAPAARYIRPYTITAGRTQTTVDLPLEATLARTHARAGADLGVAAARLLDLCEHRSVAEVSALARLPIGVVRVLLGDLVEHQLITVQTTITERTSTRDRIALLERTLRGLRTY